MKDKITLANEQVKAIITWIEKASKFVSNVESKYPEIYADCMNSTPDFIYDVTDVQDFISQLKEFIREVKMKDTLSDELTFTELKNSDNFSIIKEHKLVVSGDICDFYTHGKIRDHKTGKETYIREDLLDVLFLMFEKYAITQLKRKGVYDLVNEKEQLREDINTNEQLKEFVSKIDYNNKEQVEALKDYLKLKYPNINKLWEV